MTMKRGIAVWLCLLFLLPCRSQCLPSQYLTLNQPPPDDQPDHHLMAIRILNRSGLLSSLLPFNHQPPLRQARAPRPLSQTPKRTPQGSRFALSLDVPTSILSVLIDLAKNHDMRAKAAANAELMARIGKRK